MRDNTHSFYVRYNYSDGFDIFCVILSKINDTFPRQTPILHVDVGHFRNHINRLPLFAHKLEYQIM